MTDVDERDEHKYILGFYSPHKILWIVLFGTGLRVSD